MFDQTNATTYGAPTYGVPQYSYNGFQQPVVKVNNVLTAEEIKELQADKTQFVLGLTHKEQLQAACTHRSTDGTSDSLVFDPITGIARCTICGYEFRPVEPNETPEALKEVVDKCVDYLQTIKIMYTDLPGEAVREFFQIIPMLMKIPQLFEFAAKNFNKHELNQWGMNSVNMGGVQMLNNLSNIFGAPVQPMASPQPMMQPNMAAGYPQQAYGNPFGYPGAAAPQPMMGGYQPQMQGYQYQPTQVATPVAPTDTAPVAPATENATVTQTVTV